MSEAGAAAGKEIEPWKNFKNVKVSDSSSTAPDYLRFIVTSEENREVSVVKGKGELPTDLVIPSTVTLNGQTYSVTSVAQWGFEGCSKLTTVVLPESITSIAYNAFAFCNSLTAINLSNGLISIDSNAFYSCSGLTDINFPTTVTTIGEYAFFDCSSLTSVTIPKSVTAIGEHAFSNCENLTEIIVETGNSYYCSDNGALYNFEKTTIIKCPERKEDYALPAGVTTIGGHAFVGCSRLTSVSIPEGVTSVGQNAFTGCSSLTSISLPKSITSIGGFAFSSCSSLTSISIPEGVTSIDQYTFYNCGSLTAITIPESVTSIADAVFSNCTSLTSISIPESVTAIGSSAFAECALTSIILPKGVTFIDEEAFYGCTALSEITYLADEPIEGYSNIFDSSTYETATLYMSEAGAAAGKGIDPWKNFKNVKVSESSSLNGVVADFNAEEPCEVFTLNGVKVADNADNLPAGVYIVRQGNTVKKIAVK